MRTGAEPEKEQDHWEKRRETRQEEREGKGRKGKREDEKNRREHGEEGENCQTEGDMQILLLWFSPLTLLSSQEKQQHCSIDCI